MSADDMMRDKHGRPPRPIVSPPTPLHPLRSFLLGVLISSATFVFGVCLYAGTHRDGALYAALQMVAVFVGIVAVGLLGAAFTMTPRERVRR